MQVTTDLFSQGLTAAAAGTAASEASGTIDREDFLALLVAQLQNQDPLNPLESAEFSSQLAQFSSLEQLMQINDGIEALNGSSTGGAGLDALGLLGHQVRAASGEVEVGEGGHSDLTFELGTPGAVEVEISTGGVSLGSFSLGERSAGTHALELSDLDGLPPLSEGAYTVTVRSVGAGGLVETVPTFVLGQVTGVDLNDGNAALLLGGRRISLADVREVRSATDPAPSGDSPDDEPPTGET